MRTRVIVVRCIYKQTKTYIFGCLSGCNQTIISCRPIQLNDGARAAAAAQRVMFNYLIVRRIAIVMMLLQNALRSYRCVIGWKIGNACNANTKYAHIIQQNPEREREKTNVNSTFFWHFVKMWTRA